MELEALRCRYFGLRHGESQANQAGLIVSDPARGVAGFGLTERGREQVRAAVAAAGLPGSARILSSDFARARESAELAREVLGAGPVRLEPRLRERWFGRWEGGPATAYPTVWAEDARDPDHTRGGVESARAVRQRALALVAELERELGPGDTVLLVAHGDVLQLLATAFLGVGPEDHRGQRPWEPAEVRHLGGAC